MKKTSSNPRSISPAFSWLTLAVCLSTACGIQTHPMTAGELVAGEVTIRAVDGSFTLTPGESFDPPFQSTCYNLPPEQETRLRGSLTEASQVGYDIGGRRVNVLVEGRTEPLFGLLVLCDVPDSAFGPASRSYRIAVPAEYIEAASGGRISVVYEQTNRHGPNGATTWWYGWILWLSDRPY